MNNLNKIFELVTDNAPKPFSEHNFETQKAIAYWMLIDGSAWYDDIPEFFHFLYNHKGWNDNLWKLVIKFLLIKRSNVLYHYAEIPTSLIIDAIMEEKNCISHDFNTFDEYHKWYMSGSVPQHSKLNRYPCLLENSSDIILDGWHRFHSYVENNDVTIPVIYNVNN